MSVGMFWTGAFLVGYYMPLPISLVAFLLFVGSGLLNEGDRL